MSGGQVALVTIAAVLVLTLGGILLSRATQSHLPTGRQTDAVFATLTPSPTATPLPTATATRTMVPQSGIGDHMQLGTDYIRTATGFTLIGQRGQFAAADPLAVVVVLDGPLGTTSVAVVITHVYADGTETVVASGQQTFADPGYTRLAIKYDRTDSLVNYGPPAIYRYALKTDRGTLAQATFNYLG
jgi:hypothetical protein